jgi:hypothetical protein
MDNFRAVHVNAKDMTSGHAQLYISLWIKRKLSNNINLAKIKRENNSEGI